MNQKVLKRNEVYRKTKTLIDDQIIQNSKKEKRKYTNIDQS